MLNSGSGQHVKGDLGCKARWEEVRSYIALRQDNHMLCNPSYSKIQMVDVKDGRHDVYFQPEVKSLNFIYVYLEVILSRLEFFYKINGNEIVLIST